MNGMDRFREHFEVAGERFALIGGVAVEHWLTQAALPARRTKDFDVVLYAELLDDSFLDLVWAFIKAAGYASRQGSSGERRYYRFAKPKDPSFPAMLEIFSRRLVGLPLPPDQEITPIPPDADGSSLSAILLDDHYYRLVKENRELAQGLPMVRPEALVLLKAKAWLDLTARPPSPCGCRHRTAGRRSCRRRTRRPSSPR